jgi:nucleotide-binding universal stress UspA family protein
MFPTKVLVAVDDSAEAGVAARMAAVLAAKTGSELHVVHAAPLPSPVGAPEGTIYDPDVSERLREMAAETGREVLQDQARQMSGGKGAVKDTHLRIGRPDHHVTEVAEELGAGLIVVGSRGRGPLKRALMGSVSDSIVRHAHCPVLVVRNAHDGEVLFGARILLAVDGSEESRLAEEAAAELAEASGAELHVVFALRTEPEAPYPHALLMEGWREALEESKRKAREFVHERAAELGSKRKVTAQAHLAFGEPVAEIVQLAEELGAGLVVVGSRGLGGVRRALLGSVSNAVVHHAHCPVFVVRAVKDEPDGRMAAQGAATEDAGR